MTEQHKTRDGGLDADVISATSKEFVTSHALLVGIDAYENQIPQLTTAVNDANALAKTLESLHNYQVKTLTDQKATRSNLLDELNPDQADSWASQLGPDDRAIFYFAGHGLAEQGDDGPAGYLLPQDAHKDQSNSGAEIEIEVDDPSKLDRLERENNFLEMSRLYKQLANLPCRHMLIILDCCFAGAMRWATIKKRAIQIPPKTIHRQRYQHYIQSPAWQLLTSAAYDQKALDVLRGRMYAKARSNPGDRHSPFAQALIDALSKDVADTFPPPTNGQPAGDGLLTIYELFQYLEETVWQGVTQIEHVQTPELWPLEKHRNGQFVFDIPGKTLNLPDAGTLTLDHNPYRGLESFETDDYHLFFGRQKAVEDLVRQVADTRLTVVLGASGTGKSSLVKAGLLPVLNGDTKLRPDEAQPRLTDLQAGETLTVNPTEWFILPPLRPTVDPLGQLTEHLRQEFKTQPDLKTNHPHGLAKFLTKWATDNPKKRLLLTIDQFEEMITACGEQERITFLELLANALRVQPDWFRLVITLRTDFEPQLAYLPLKPYWEAGRFIVQPMNRRELQGAIEGPASERILYFEPPELVGRLVDEVVDTPGALPLLSFALKRIYINYIERHSDNRAITEADYAALGSDERLGGGVIGALRHTANEEYSKLNEAEQSTMRRIMLRMISTEGGELTRRKVPLTELEYSDPAENERVTKIIDRLTGEDVRLLVMGSLKQPNSSTVPYIEPAHDALVRAWDKLAQWIRAPEIDLSLQRRLTPNAVEWANQRDPKKKQEQLWHSNPNLPGLEEIITGQPSSQVANFVIRLWQRMIDPWRDATLIPTTKHWLNKLELDFVQASVRRRQKDIRQTVGLTLGVIVVLATLTIFAFAQQQSAVRANNDLAAEVVIRTTAEADAVNAAAVAQSEANARATEVVIRSTAEANAEVQRDEAIRQFQIAHSRELSSESAEAFASRQDNLALLLAIEAGEQASTLEAFQAIYRSLSRLTKIQSSLIHGDHVIGASWDSNEGLILTSSKDGTVRVWDTKNGEEKFSFQHEGLVGEARWNSDESVILTRGTDVVRVWDSSNGEEKFSLFHEDIQEARWNSDESLILTLGADMVRVWDGSNGEEKFTLSHEGRLWGGRWNSDESLILTLGADMVRVWDGSNGEEKFSLFHEGVLGARWNSDESLILTIGSDSRLKVWNTSDQQQKFSLPYDGYMWGVRWNSDESLILTIDSDGRVRSWNVKDGEEKFRLKHDSRVDEAQWNSDESLILTRSWDDTARVWDGSNGEEKFSLFHEGIQEARWNSDESVILTRGADMVRVWDGSNGEEKFRLKHDSPVNEARWNSDESLILTRSWDDTARVWGASDGLERLSLIHDDQVYEARWNSDESLILTHSRDGTVRVWDATDGLENYNLPHQDGIGGAQWNSDESLILTRSGSTVRVWDARDRQSRFSFQHDDRVDEVQWNSDESLILTHSWDGTARVWDVRNGQQKFSMLHDDQVYEAQWNSDESLILTQSRDGTARVWDARNGQQKFSMLHDDQVYEAQWNSDGSLILTRSGNGTAGVWDARNGQQILSLQHDNPVDEAQWNGDESLILTRSDNRVRVWDAQTGQEKFSLLHGDATYDAKWNGDESLILTGSWDGTARVWDARNGREKFSLPHINFNVRAQWNSNESLILTTDGDMIDDTVIQIWDARDGQEKFSLPHKGMLNEILWNNDGTLILARGPDLVRVWDARNGQQILSHQHNNRVDEAHWNRDGSLILTGSWDGTVRVWDARNGQQILSLQHEGSVSEAQWNSDESLILTRSGSSRVRVWDAQTGQEKFSLPHGGNILEVRWNSDESLILTVGCGQEKDFICVEGMVRVWNAKDGQEKFSLPHKSSVNEVYFNSDETLILTRSEDGAIHMWETQMTDLLKRACTRLSFNMTRDVWRQYFRDEPYRPTCPKVQIPLETINEIVEDEVKGPARVGEVEMAHLRLTELKGWLVENGQYPNYAEEFKNWLNRLQAGENPFEESE